MDGQDCTSLNDFGIDMLENTQEAKDVHDALARWRHAEPFKLMYSVSFHKVGGAIRLGQRLEWG